MALTPQLILVFARASLHVQFLRNCLQSQYDIVEATSDTACMEMLRNMRVDFLVFDEKLIKTEIEPFLKEIKELPEYSHLPILMISRNLKKPYVRMMKELGVCAFIREPLDETEILITLKKCDRKEQMRTRISQIASRIPKAKPNQELEFKHRYLLNDQAAEQIRQVLKEKQSISLLMLELDQYYAIAQTIGKANAEPILDQIDEKLQSILRPQDLLISLGGAKYMVILPKTSKNAAKVLAEDLQTSIEMNPFKGGQEHFHMGVSIGVASRNVDELEDSAQSMEQLHRLANLAKGYVIESKHSGGQIISEGIE